MSRHNSNRSHTDGEADSMASIRVTTRVFLDESDLMTAAVNILEEDREWHRRMAGRLERLIFAIQRSALPEKEPIISELQAVHDEHLATAEGTRIWVYKPQPNGNGHSKLPAKLQEFDVGC